MPPRNWSVKFHRDAKELLDDCMKPYLVGSPRVLVWLQELANGERDGEEIGSGLEDLLEDLNQEVAGAGGTPEPLVPQDLRESLQDLVYLVTHWRPPRSLRVASTTIELLTEGVPFEVTVVYVVQRAQRRIVVVEWLSLPGLPDVRG